MDSSSFCCCTYGINNMHHKTHIKPVIENCTTSLVFFSFVLLWNEKSISEHYFHILCYIFDSNFDIHKQHYLNDISSDVYSKGKKKGGGGPALMSPERKSQVWSQNSNLQLTDKTEEPKEKNRNNGCRLAICRGITIL